MGAVAQKTMEKFTQIAETEITEKGLHEIVEAALQKCSYEKVFLKICSKSTGEHPCRSAVPIKLQSNFVEVTLRHGCSPIILLYIFRTSFLKNTSRRLLLK